MLNGRAAVVFDLDGTLVNSLGDLAASMNRTLIRHGHPTHPTDAYRWFVGDGIENLTRRALPQDFRAPEQVAQALQEMRGRLCRALGRPDQAL